MTASALTLLDDLARLGIRFSARPGGNLWFTPREALTPDLIERLREHKAEFRDAIGPDGIFGSVNPGWSPACWITRLRQLADTCERVRPDRAAFLRLWAFAVERDFAMSN